MNYWVGLELVNNNIELTVIDSYYGNRWSSEIKDSECTLEMVDEVCSLLEAKTNRDIVRMCISPNECTKLAIGLAHALFVRFGTKPIVFPGDVNSLPIDGENPYKLAVIASVAV